MPARIMERTRRAGSLAKIVLFALEGVVLLAVSAVLLRYGRRGAAGPAPVCARTDDGVSRGAARIALAKQGGGALSRHRVRTHT